MWETFGHDNVIDFFTKVLANERIGHAYLLSGQKHLGKFTFAMELAQAVNCLNSDRPCKTCLQCTRISKRLHPDVRVLGGDQEMLISDNRHITIDEVRTVQVESSRKPFEGKSKVFILDNVESMTMEAGNALLKTLEEPPSQVLYILISTDISRVLETIISRCTVFEFAPVETKKIVDYFNQNLKQKPSIDLQYIAKISRGKIGWAMKAIEEPNVLSTRESNLEALQSLITENVTKRLDYVEEILSDRTRSLKLAIEQIELWYELWRDVLVLVYNLPELLIYTKFTKNLKKVAGSLSAAEVIRCLKLTRSALDDLRQNHNIAITFERMLLNFPVLGKI
tara:strand:- start:1141 stop:2154 length:1014 start_codon:yes stop_codon:yes gene_type:complete